jgi:hypothetical protein
MATSAPLCPCCQRSDRMVTPMHRDDPGPSGWFCDRCCGWVDYLAGLMAQERRQAERAAETAPRTRRGRKP